MRTQLRPAIVSFAILTILTGVLYPLAITGVAQVIFPHQANGSLIAQNGKVVGSELIGQSFDNPGYFWGRLSATSPYPNNAPIPVDLVTASGSGLDPDISIAAALLQVGRVAKARGLSEDDVIALVGHHTQRKQFGLLGE